MTLIVLAVLATAWLGYFVLWFRERRASQPIRTAGMVDFNRPFRSTSRGLALTGGSGPGSPNRGELDAPRSVEKALSRRRQVVAVVGAVAVASLLAVPPLGAAALAVHVLADVALLLFTFGAVRRQQAPAPGMAEARVLYPQQAPAPGMAEVRVLYPQQAPAPGMAEVRVLYPQRPAGEVAAAPLRRVVNG